MEQRRFPTNPADPSRATQSVGPYRFSLEHRDVGGDGGLTIHVFGPKNGNDEELLRFDRFRTAPHYHLGLSYRDAPSIRIDDPHPFRWALELLASSFETLLDDAGADMADRSAWEHEFLPMLESLKREGQALTAH